MIVYISGMLKHEPTLAVGGVHTAENEPPKILRNNSYVKRCVGSRTRPVEFEADQAVAGDDPFALNELMKRAQEKRGIVYLGSIPPRMKPQKLRQLLTPHGALDRIFLTPEDPAIRARRKQARSVVSFCHRAGPPLRDRVRVSVSFASHAVVNLTF